MTHDRMLAPTTTKRAKKYARMAERRIENVRRVVLAPNALSQSIRKGIR